MIKEEKIFDEDGKGIYTMFHSTDFEFVNPTQHYGEAFIRTNVSMMRDILFFKQLPIPASYIEEFIHREAVKDWKEKLEEITNTEVPEKLILLLKSTSKKEQVALLKGLTITPDQLIAFIVKAWTDFGFSFSQYTSEHQHAGLDKKEMPRIVEIKDDKVYKVGETTLTDGQLRQAVDHRKVIVSKFLDGNDSWHCLFLTYDSLKGKEAWKSGQPHYHYISDKFGIPREKVVEQLKSRNYKLGNLPHIDLIGYRPDEE